jgi:hypothetical protein
MTAGFAKPETASSGVKNLPINKILKISNAVTSRGNFSVTKREKAKTISINTNNISKFIIIIKLG